MGSTDPDRSISSGISIPQWMKNKINDRYDIEETFSPPIHDDTFFYIRYPKSTRAHTTETKKVEESFLKSTETDFSQHTQPCREFIPTAPMNTDIKGPSFAKSASQRVKPQDDEIAGESGACGKSVVDVAKQMISGKSVLRGFSVAGSNDNLAVPSGGFDPAKRRGSKSLPASPLGSPAQSPASSPRIQRKVAHPNRFFTGTFQVLDKTSTEESSNFGNWIWPGFLGNRDNAFSSSKALTIQEEDHVGESSSGNVDASKKILKNVQEPLPVLVSAPSADKNSSTIGGLGNSSSNIQNKLKLHPKPSELREMNFWSPTSM